MTLSRGGQPSPDQFKRLERAHDAITLGFEIAEKALKSRHQGGGTGGGILTVIVSTVLAAAVAMGLPGMLNHEDAAQARIIAESMQADVIPRLAALEISAAEEERRHRRATGLTIRWLGDEQLRHCRGMQAIAAGINSLADAQPRSKNDHKPVTIDCDQSGMPPELAELVAQSRQTDLRQDR